jgi:hypothetical protein
MPCQQGERLCRRYTSLSIYARIVLLSASAGGRDEIAACVGDEPALWVGTIGLWFPDPGSRTRYGRLIDRPRTPRRRHHDQRADGVDDIRMDDSRPAPDRVVHRAVER